VPSEDAVIDAVELIDPDLLDSLKDLAMASETAEDFANAIFAGECPACGCGNTETCEEVKGIGNILVGRCRECSTLFCTDLCRSEGGIRLLRGLV
jgi:hypothetical protein